MRGVIVIVERVHAHYVIIIVGVQVIKAMAFENIGQIIVLFAFGLKLHIGGYRKNRLLVYLLKIIQQLQQVLLAEGGNGSLSDTEAKWVSWMGAAEAIK